MISDPSKYSRRLDQIGIGFLVLVLLMIATGLSRIQTNTEDVMAWLPDNSSARDAYELFQNNFASDDFVVLSWDGCTTEDSRLTELANRIRSSESAPLIESVVTGPEAINRLETELNFQRGDAVRALRGIFFGLENPKKTCLVVELNAEGTNNRGAFMRDLWDTLNTMPQLDRERVSIGGYPYLANYFDQQIKQSFLKMLLPSVIIATAVAMFCLRNLALTIIVFATSGLAAGASVAFLPICGAKFGGLSSIIPTLTFVLTISGCLHLIRYNLESIGNARELLRIAWKPCTISTSTTAIGMLSLTRSNFPAIRDFGFYCAAGVLFSLLFQLIVIPWLLTRFGQPGLKILAHKKENSFFWTKFLALTDRFRGIIVIATMALVAVALVGLGRLEASVEVDGFFEPDSPVVQNIANLERQLGPLDQTEAVVIFNNASANEFLQRYQYVRQLQDAWLALPDIDVAHSLLNYLPKEPKKLTGRSLIQRTIFRRKLQSQRDKMANGLFLKINGNQEMWRISLRFPFTRSSDFSRLQESVTQVAETQAAQASVNQPAFLPPEFVFSGKTFLFHHAQETLLGDLFKNFLLAFLIITPLLIGVLRSVGLGLIAMIPNIMPALLVFGTLGLLNKPVDLAIAMTASVALGIAVDDTSHFLIRFREFGGSLFQVSPQLTQAIRQCGPAMLHTTLISCAGIGCSYFSSLHVMSRFASTISLLLMIALLADVLMLPAILFAISRIGKPQPSSATGNEKPTTNP